VDAAVPAAASCGRHGSPGRGRRADLPVDACAELVLAALGSAERRADGGIVGRLRDRRLARSRARRRGRPRALAGLDLCGPGRPARVPRGRGERARPQRHRDRPLMARIAEAESRSRLARCGDAMRREGFDALIAYASHVHYGSVRYFTGYEPWLTPEEW